MQYTENYNLNKPEFTDVADITKLSDNMDIIDEELEKRTTKSGFLTDLIAHLASDAAIAISSLSTDSVFYRLLSYALNAAGVQYNFQNANAWYICLGALFGGLIIQGGKGWAGKDGESYTNNFAISFNNVPHTICAIHKGVVQTVNIVVDTVSASAFVARSNHPYDIVDAYYVAFGI